MDGITPVMNVGNNPNNDWGAMGLGGFGGIIGLLAVLGMIGNGNLFGNWGGDRFGYQPQYAMQADVQNGFNFADLQDQNRDILTAINNGTSQGVAVVNSTFHDTVNVVKDAQNALAGALGDIRVMLMQLQSNQNECCCSTKMLISDKAADMLAAINQNRYEAAMNTASVNATMVAAAQQIKDMFQEWDNRNLRQEVSDLKDRLNMVGVVRYPLEMSYNAGNSPFCRGCNNGYSYQ